MPMGKTAVLLIASCDAHGLPLQRGGEPFVASVHGPAACQTEVHMHMHVYMYKHVHMHVHMHMHMHSPAACQTEVHVLLDGSDSLGGSTRRSYWLADWLAG